jgi:hypothetical protein
MMVQWNLVVVVVVMDAFACRSIRRNKKPLQAAGQWKRKRRKPFEAEEDAWFIFDDDVDDDDA